jgi:protein-S-isoprenylcysteine O-methyltransferase Ste14
MPDPVQRTRTLDPPPLVYPAGMMLAWWLEQWFTLGFDVSPLLRRLGWTGVGAGGALMLWAALTIWRHRTTVNPYWGASALVTDGPFAFSRNPIYLADIWVYCGVTLLFGSLWPLVLAPLVWAIMRYGVIAHEEAHLRARFDAAYCEYCVRVRRWI